MSCDTPAQLQKELRAVVDQADDGDEDSAFRLLEGLIAEHGYTLVTQTLIIFASDSVRQVRRQLPLPH